MLTLLSNDPALFIFSCFILGLLVGSFLNVVIHRLPIMMEKHWKTQCAELQGTAPVQPCPPYNLLTPRSACPHCGHTLSALENVPLISYTVQRGRCRSCGASISIRYPLVELSCGLLSAAVAWHFGYGFAVLAALPFIWALLALTCIDLDTQLLPDDLTLPLLWLGLAANLAGAFTPLESAVIGAIAGYLALWTVYWAFRLATGKEGMGYGDFKLLAAIGAWLGWQMLPLVILLSSLVGAIVGIGLILLTRHGRNIPIPFGPYLAGGGAIALFWGPQLTQSYLLFAAP